MAAEPQDYSSYYVRIYHLWANNNKTEFSRVLYELYGHAENPFQMALVFVKLSPDLYRAKGSGLAANILVGLQNFLHQPGYKERYAACITDDIQLKVFEIAICQKNSGVLRLMVTSFGLTDNGHKFLPRVRVLVNENRLKEACSLVTLLGLQENFSTQELIVPLFLQDQLNLADDILASSPQHQRELLIFIDNIIGKKIVLEDILDKYKVKDPKKIKSNKSLCNIASKLLKRFDNIDASICPNLIKRRATGGLRYIFYKFYIEKGIQKPTFFSLIDDAVKIEDKDLQKELMYLFVEYRDDYSAIPYVHKFKFPMNKLPSEVQDILNDPNHKQNLKDISQDSSQEEECWNEADSQGYYRLSIPWEKVVLVDTVEGFEQCMTAAQSATLVGLDTEWKPTFGLGATEQVALMQLAFTSQVYLLDTLTLQKVLEERHWYKLSQMFVSPIITKLGYGISGDFNALQGLHPTLARGIASVKNFLDFDRIKNTLLSDNCKIFSYDSSLYKGLSDMVYRCFGLPLNKSEQFSTWATRPLTRSQMTYAALDAQCLIDIYNYLVQRSEALSIPEWKNVKPEKKTSKSKDDKKNRKANRNKEPAKYEPRTSGQVIPASQFRAVCDVMVQGLAKQLRSCGIDAVALETGQDCDSLIQYYEKENRVVFTRGGNFNRLRKYIPAEYVYSVQNEIGKKQLAEVLEVFNIQVTPSDVFARCSLCNSGSFIIAPCWAIKTLKENLTVQEGAHNMVSNPSDQWLNCKGGNINLACGETNQGVKVIVKHVAEQVFLRVQEFYLCAKCGKCYWEGSHYDHVLEGRLNGLVQHGTVGNIRQPQRPTPFPSQRTAESGQPQRPTPFPSQRTMAAAAFTPASTSRPDASKQMQALTLNPPNDNGSLAHQKI